MNTTVDKTQKDKILLQVCSISCRLKGFKKNTGAIKTQEAKILLQVERLAHADLHPKLQYLRSYILHSVKDKDQSTMLLVKSR
jgi:hypothetical protein